jgi:tRNA-dihydrouridine synthase
MIKEIKEALSIPVIANGGIYTFADVERCLSETGVDAVMSAESLLENPALFSGKLYDLDDLAFEYMQLAKEYSARYCEIKAHLFRISFTGLQTHTDLRERMTKARDWNDMNLIIVELRERRKGEDPVKKLGWYVRYWHKFNK